MKKYLLITILIIFNYSFSQSGNFEFSKDGFTDYVVTEIPNLKANEIYIKAINWVKENYVNPDEVIKMTIENEKLRINGISKSYTCSNMMGIKACSDANYTIEISFKDNKYKFDPIELININSVNPSAKSNFDFYNTSMYYNKKGELKSSVKNYPIDLEALFNNLNNSLKNYVLDFNKKEKEGW